MRMTLIGYRNYSFISERDGKQVEGTTLYLGKDTFGIVGKEPVKASISRTLADRCSFFPEVGAEVEVEYDDKGKVRGIFNT